ncbi:MAG: hypothetical protein U0Z70_06990 [Thermomicrobiales bacterium]
MNKTILPQVGALQSRDAVAAVVVMCDPLMGLSQRGRILSDELSAAELLDVAALTFRIEKAARYVNQLAGEALDRQLEQQLRGTCSCPARTVTS